MPLQTGNWLASVNGQGFTLQITNVDSRGGVGVTTLGKIATSTIGFWDEDAQKLTLVLDTDVFTGYLFTDPINLAGVTGSVIFTLAGFVECFQPASSFVAATAKRAVFGWYAQIGVD